MARALINIPAKATKGQVVEIKTMLSHPMETGFRPKVTFRWKDDRGQVTEEKRKFSVE